jgi:hypothetical protein
MNQSKNPLNMLTPLLRKTIIADYADESLSDTEGIADHFTIIDPYVRMKYSNKMFLYVPS